MNKFKRLQLTGALVLTSPVILVALAVNIFYISTMHQEEVVEVVEVKAPKADSVIVLKEVEKVAPPAPVVKKPVVVPVPAPAPTPPVIKDTVKKVTAELDTAK